MAIDTVSKRRSALGAFQVWPLADATIDASDRRAAAWVYTGFESGTATPDSDATSDHVEKGPLRRIRRPHGRELPIPEHDWLLPVALIALLDADEPY